MQALVEDLLLLARADERGLTMAHADVDLDDLVASEVERLCREVSLDIKTDVTPTRISGDAVQLSRMLRNLLDNAARHAKSEVSISAHACGQHAVLTVDDDGPGIAPQDRERVFGRFVRLDANRSRSAGGAGLGLAIVREIVVAHQGSVAISDAPGGGARVTVQLPLAYAPDSSR